MLVGAGVSSTDIARELGPLAKKIYQSSRGGFFDLPEALLPENAVRIGEITSFDEHHMDVSEPNEKLEIEEAQPIPNTVTLADGKRLENIDRVLICTGYHCSFPFLREYHRDAQSVESADDTALVTDGSQMHNLHKDIFYIPDPTLSFVRVPYHVATFTLFEFQAIVVAAVYSGKAKLPSREPMRDEYQVRVREKGYGRKFHSLMGKEVEYANSLLDWINRDGQLIGENLVHGHTKEWHAAYAEFRATIMKRFESETA